MKSLQKDDESIFEKCILFTVMNDVRCFIFHENFISVGTTNIIKNKVPLKQSNMFVLFSSFQNPLPFESFHFSTNLLTDVI